MTVRLLPALRQPVWHAFSGTSTLAAGARRSNIVLTEGRLQEFMNAEISHFAQMSAQPVALSQILSASTPVEVASLICEHLPKHFATRIKHLEKLPLWDTVPEIQEVHGILSESFRNLRLVEQSPDLLPLTGVIRDLRSRHKCIIRLLASAVATLRSEQIIEEAFANQWLDEFLVARMSTEMLTAHFMSTQAGQEDASGSCTGIVDSKCNPGQVCQQAAEKISADADCSSVRVSVESHACTSSREMIEFSFLPQYLSLIVQELLRNAVRATIRYRSRASHCGNARDETVRVIVAADQRQVKIQVSDNGGGIRPSEADSIWSYALSSFEEQGDNASWGDPMGNFTSWADPLSGLGLKRRIGMGLPLIKLYTEYLGGTLELMSLSGVGVDAYLSFRRIEARGGTTDVLASE